MNDNNYPIPLYLNQRTVFDILAMMEGGLSQFESVQTTESVGQQQASRISGDVGVRNVFAFLGVSFGGEKSGGSTATSAQQVSKEKIYTPNALFAKMRERLFAENKIVDKLTSDLAPGMFVEFKTSLSKNPLIQALESIQAFISLYFTFSEAAKPKAISKSSKGNDVGSHLSNTNATAVFNQAKSLITTLLRELTAEGSLDLIGTAPETGITAVLTIDKAFLTDPTLGDLLDGEYAVIGKITRSIAPSSGDKINLLRKTNFGVLQEKFLSDFTKSFETLGDTNITLPKIVTDIGGPAIQLLPIAIFA